MGELHVKATFVFAAREKLSAMKTEGDKKYIPFIYAALHL